MTVVRNHHYVVEPAEVDELIARRAKLIAALRAAHPGLVNTRLTRLADGTFTDVWQWESAKQMGAAMAALGQFPEAREAMSLVRENNAQNGEVLDER